MVLVTLASDRFVDLKDVYGATMTDQVDITFYNQRVQSLKQRFSVQFQRAPVVLKDVPASPLGLAEVFIKPTRYGYKSIIPDIPAGDGVVDLFAPTDTADSPSSSIPSKHHSASVPLGLRSSPSVSLWMASRG